MKIERRFIAKLVISNFVGAIWWVALFIVGGGSAGAGVVVWCGWDFCVRSNRKNRDSAKGRGGIAEDGL
jgi:hypothetical protein